MENQDKTAQPDLLKQNPANQPSPLTGGPQFGSGDKGGWGSGFRGWINKYGSSVILPIVALLILAGGIYLYASQKGEEITLTLEEETTASLEEIAGLTEEGFTEELTEETIGATTEETFIEEIIPEGRKEQGTIIEKAVKGDGITHLARRALKDYLKDRPEELSKEHKIYIEDYLKDRIGPRPLEIDEEITFSEDLIQEAINDSIQLSPDQLKNLEQYSALVAW